MVAFVLSLILASQSALPHQNASAKPVERKMRKPTDEKKDEKKEEKEEKKEEAAN